MFLRLDFAPLAITDRIYIGFTGHLGDTTESQAELHINAVGDDENPIKFGTQTPGENGVHLASRYEEPQQLQRTSFDTVPFRAKSYGFDDNYVLKGRYGFDLDDPAKPIEPRGLSRDENDVLPQSGIAQASDSPSEGDTTIGKNHLH